MNLRPFHVSPASCAASCAALLKPSLCALLCLLITLAHFGVHAPVADDAFIHFRIAEHLVSTGKPFFNVDSAVATSSSLAWTVLLAGMNKLGVPLQMGVRILNWLVLLAMPVLTLAIGRQLQLRRGDALTVGCLFAACSTYAGVLLMETRFALLVALSGIFFWLRGSLLGPFLFGTAPFIRPELALAIPLSLVGFQTRRAISLPFSLFAIVLAACPWLFLSWQWFGGIIPQAVKAKSIVYAVIDRHQLLPLFVPQILLHDDLVAPVLMKACLVAILFGFLRCFMNGHPNRFVCWSARLSVFFSVAVAGGYTFGKAFIHEWYVPLVVVPAVYAGLIGLLDFRSRLRPLLLTCLWAAPLVGVATLAVASFSGASCFETRTELYARVGTSLRATIPEVSVMSAEIGALGYSFKGNIIDAVGLASPEALVFHPLPVPEARSSSTLGAIPPDFVKASRPDVVVSYERFAEKLLSLDCRELGYDRYIISRECRAGDHEKGLSHLNILIKRELISSLPALQSTLHMVKVHKREQ